MSRTRSGEAERASGIYSHLVTNTLTVHPVAVIRSSSAPPRLARTHLAIPVSLPLNNLLQIKSRYRYSAESHFRSFLPRLALAPLTLCLVLIGQFALPSANAGSLAADTDFRTPFFAEPATAGRNLLLPDGKFFLFSRPDTLTDQRTGAITRYLPDGTLDTTFHFSRLYKSVSAAAPTPDGKL